MLKTKLHHIDIYQHWLWQEVQARWVYIKWISSADMPVDSLTKVLPCQKHEQFITQLNLIDIHMQLSLQPPS